jgi:hypothetical protein
LICGASVRRQQRYQIGVDRSLSALTDTGQTSARISGLIGPDLAGGDRTGRSPSISDNRQESSPPRAIHSAHRSRPRSTSDGNMVAK